MSARACSRVSGFASYDGAEMILACDEGEATLRIHTNEDAAIRVVEAWKGARDNLKHPTYQALLELGEERRVVEVVVCAEHVLAAVAVEDEVVDVAGVVAGLRRGIGDAVGQRDLPRTEGHERAPQTAAPQG